MNKVLRDQVMQPSPAEHPDLPPVTKAQLAEAKRRLAEHRADPASAAYWKDVRARQWSRLGQ